MSKTFMHIDVSYDNESHPFVDSEGEAIPMFVSRTLTSTGYKSITIRVGDQQILLDNHLFEDNLEDAALKLVELLDVACENPIELPELKP